MNPRTLLNRLDSILAQVVEALEDDCNPVAQWALETQEPTFDKCCDGYAYIRVIRMNKVDPFFQQNTTPSNCGFPNGALVEVGVLRCAPTLSVNGNAPSAEEIQASSVEVYEDSQSLYEVLASHNPVWAQAPLAIEQWIPLVQDGGCVGGAWQFWMDVALVAPECDIPEDTEKE